MRFQRMNAFTGVLLALLSACSYQENKTPPGGDIPASSLSSFSGLAANVFEPKCVRCHNPAKTEGNVDLSSHAAAVNGRGIVAGNPRQSLVYSEVASGAMPEGGSRLSDNEIDAISDWIQAGAPNGEFPREVAAPPQPVTPPPAPPPPVTPPSATFSEVQKVVLNPSCISCHSGAHPKGQVNLSSYSAIRNDPKHRLVTPGTAAKSLLYTEISKGSMPPRGPAIPPKDLAILRDWINQGAKNN